MKDFEKRGLLFGGACAAVFAHAAPDAVRRDAAERQQAAIDASGGQPGYAATVGAKREL